MIAALDAAAWARQLGISRAAVDLYLASEVIDLHLDSFIWQRLVGYDLTASHATPPLGGWFLGHADFPRVRQANLAGATWVVSTNPLRDAADRFETLLHNLARFVETVELMAGDLAIVRTATEYRAARAAGKHAVFVGIQGGNALDGPDDAVERLPPGLVLRVTLLHLSNSALGYTSSPLRLGPDEGLRPRGRDLVRRLDDARILVDLAHISPQGFWDALEIHDPSLPVVVTHTGVSGVHRHWRNLDDSQIRAVAGSGGVVGIMFHSAYLGGPAWWGRAERVVRHVCHVVKVAGEDYAALGSDFDGAIVPPRDLRSVLDMPRLVELMLGRGLSERAIVKILGQNFLRVLASVRP